jgi:hypothetical protein
MRSAAGTLALALLLVPIGQTLGDAVTQRSARRAPST